MCLKLIVLVSILLCMLLSPCMIQAATSVDVTITAIGFIIAPPSGFSVSYISDYETALTWTNPVGSISTMVRAAYGHVPTDMADGYLVYLGNGDTVNDPNIDPFNGDSLYYRAWAQRNDGIWGGLYADTDTEDIMSLGFYFIGLIALMLVAAVLAIAAFITKRKLLAALSGLLFITIVGGVVTTPTFPMANLVIMFSLVAATAMFLSPVYFKVPPASPPASTANADRILAEADRVRKLRGQYKMKDQRGLF